MNLKNERKAFKEWVLTHPDNLDLTAYEENIMFDAWLASANREGYKIVPVEPTKNMIISGNEYYSESCGLSGLYKAMIGACDE